MAKIFCYFDTTISNKAADSSDRPKTMKLTDKDHTGCCLQMNASYVRDNNLYWAITLHKNRLYTTARKDNHANGNRSTPPTIHPFGMNTKVFFVVLQFYLWNKWPTRNSKILRLRKENQAGLKHNMGRRNLLETYKLRWSNPRLFATLVHLVIFILI